MQMSSKSCLSNTNMSYLNGKHVIRKELDQSNSNTTSVYYDGDDIDSVDDTGFV